MYCVSHDLQPCELSQLESNHRVGYAVEPGAVDCFLC